MKRFQKNLTTALIFSLFFLLTVVVQAGSSPPFEVLSIRVEKEPTACRSTLFATIRNNTQAPSDTGLFVHAAQFKELQQPGQRWSSSIGAVRLSNLPAGESREVSYSFVRERAKTGVSFMFKIVADTIAVAEMPLPPVLDQYSAKMENVVYDQAGNVLTGSVVNQGSVSIPRPGIQVYLASPDTPDSFTAAGGGRIIECLAPAQRAAFTWQMRPEAATSVIKVDLHGDGMLLDTQLHGKPPVRKPKTIEKLAPEVKREMRTIKPKNRKAFD